MADVQLAILAERWLDEVVLYAVQANVGADNVSEYVPPAGFGDCAIMEIMLQDANILTAVSTVELGFSARVVNASGSAVDFAGVGKILKVNATYVHGVIAPDPLVLWRLNEKVQVFVPELDSNASPTDDLTIYFKVVRVRPVEAPAAPIQLVR